jgi:hypothetical protein
MEMIVGSGNVDLIIGQTVSGIKNLPTIIRGVKRNERSNLLIDKSMTLIPSFKLPPITDRPIEWPEIFMNTRVVMSDIW